jgi:hypothetical protein
MRPNRRAARIALWLATKAPAALQTSPLWKVVAAGADHLSFSGIERIEITSIFQRSAEPMSESVFAYRAITVMDAHRTIAGRAAAAPAPPPTDGVYTWCC